MYKVRSALCALALGALAQPAQAQVDRTIEPAERQPSRERSGPDWRLYLFSGLSYSTRERQEGERTDYYRVPLGARVTKGPFRLSATLPYLVVDGPGAVIGGDEDELDDSPTTRDGTRSGVGDLSLTGRYRLPEDALGGFEVDLMSRVKIPTASREERLGTGEFDYAVGAELSREIGSFEPFVSGQYRFNGDRPDFDYRNTVAASVGTSLRLSRRTRANASYDYTQSRIPGRSAIQDVDLGVSTRLTRSLTLSTSGSVGLSKRAPDVRLGSTLTFRAF